MNEEVLNRIADSLERIAKLMENKEKREINKGLNEKRKKQEQAKLRKTKD